MGLIKHIINFDELTDNLKRKLLELIDDEIKNKYPQLSTNNIEALLEDIKDLLPSEEYEGLKKKIEEFVLYNMEGKQKMVGKILDVPPIIGENKAEFKFDKDIFLTGVHFNQTGWKKEDRWDLVVNKNTLINNAAIKEIGEHKYFNTYFKVSSNTPVFFILNNKSGNSRQTMVDLEYIEGKITEVIPPIPDKPDIEDIPNDWDIAVRVQWEENTAADIDLHGFMGDIHVCFWQRTYPNFYLNFDYLEHMTNCNPEVISVKGHKNKKLTIFVHNYNGVALKEPVNIKIYKKETYGNRLLKGYNLKIDNNRLLANGVCEIDLKTLKIIDLNKKINVMF